MVYLTLTRHGQTAENRDGILQGQSPGHLTDLGILQAQSLRDQLSPHDYDLIICSDLERTRRTAEIVNDRLHLPIIYTAMLRERDWGEYTGLSIKSITLPPSQFPDTIENAQQLAQRAHQFLAHILAHHDNKRILAIGHGYFNRCIHALVEQKAVHEVPRWENAELRTLSIDKATLSNQGPTDYIVSEN